MLDARDDGFDVSIRTARTGFDGINGKIKKISYQNNQLWLTISTKEGVERSVLIPDDLKTLGFDVRVKWMTPGSFSPATPYRTHLYDQRSVLKEVPDVHQDLVRNFFELLENKSTISITYYDESSFREETKRGILHSIGVHKYKPNFFILNFTDKRLVIRDLSKVNFHIITDPAEIEEIAKAALRPSDIPLLDMKQGYKIDMQKKDGTNLSVTIKSLDDFIYDHNVLYHIHHSQIALENVEEFLQVSLLTQDQLAKAISKNQEPRRPPPVDLEIVLEKPGDGVSTYELSKAISTTLVQKVLNDTLAGNNYLKDHEIKTSFMLAAENIRYDVERSIALLLGTRQPQNLEKIYAMRPIIEARIKERFESAVSNRISRFGEDFEYTPELSR
jgi:hypothetical protein